MIPALTGVVAISVGVSLLQFGVLSTDASPEVTQLAVAERGTDAGRADRGGARTEVAGVAAIAPGAFVDLTAENEEATSVANETTTTTTTAPPTTTTTKKPRPKTTRPSRSAAAPASSATPTAPAGGGSDDVWVRLAKCEAGGRNDLGAPYYGYFQFSAQTWRGVGGTGLPSDHSWDVQLSFAKKLQARSGWGQWPACSRKLGLR